MARVLRVTEVPGKLVYTVEYEGSPYIAVVLTDRSQLIVDTILDTRTNRESRSTKKRQAVANAALSDARKREGG